MIPQPTLAHPASSWRAAYAIARCTVCGDKGLFAIGAIPCCDDCLTPHVRKGIDSDLHPSDTQYHGPEFEQ